MPCYEDFFVIEHCGGKFILQAMLPFGPLQKSNEVAGMDKVELSDTVTCMWNIKTFFGRVIDMDPF